jgi:hypothetical protein
MTEKQLVMLGVLVGVISVAVAVSPLMVRASHIDALRERIEQRRAQREAEREARRQDSEESDSNQNNEEPACNCSASLRLDDPDIYWSGNSLVFVPRFDVSVRVRGNDNGEGAWNLALDYDGQAQFSSDGLTPPVSSAFAGHDEWGGQCFDTRSTFSGHAGQAVTLATIARSLFSFSDHELDSVIRMRAGLSGCDTDEEYRQFDLTVEEFGNLDLGRWRRVR